MGTKKVNLRIVRKYSEDFKKAKVREYEKGEYSILEISKLYCIHTTMIYRWIHKYSIYNKKNSKIVELKDSATKKVKELLARIQELERAVGQKQMQIDYLEKMIEIAKETCGMDIKKNSATLRSNGSGRITEK